MVEIVAENEAFKLKLKVPAGVVEGVQEWLDECVDKMKAELDTSMSMHGDFEKFGRFSSLIQNCKNSR